MNMKAFMMKCWTAPLLIATIFTALLTLQTPTVTAVTYQVGELTGKWVQYNVLGGWDAENNTIPMPQAIRDARNTQWINMTVQSVTAKAVTLMRVTQFLNNTQTSATIWGNVETGAGTLNFTVIAQGLDLGDYVINNVTSLKILKQQTETYANAPRETSYSNFTETIRGGASTREYHFIWDQITGFMLDSLFVEEDSTTLGGTIATVEIKIQKTNLWEHGTSSDTNLFPPSTVNALIITGLIATAATLAGYAVLHKSKPRKTRTRRHT